MSKLEFIQRYNLIINFLKRGKASFKDISNYLKRESEIHDYIFFISQRTFQRDVKEISSIYGIEIKCNKSTGLYEIVEGSEDLTNTSNIQLLETVDLFNALNLTNKYNQLIQFSSRIPKGTEHLLGLLHALKNRLYIKLNYKKFYSEIVEERNVEPLLIKEFKGRYYLIAFDIERNAIRTFGLERIVDFTIGRKRFKQKANINTNEIFKNAYGIIAPSDAKIENIILKFNKNQGEYIKSYPFHNSQRLLKEDKNYVTFELKIYITEDFVFELMSHSGHFSIIQPASLKNYFKKVYRESIDKI